MDILPRKQNDLEGDSLTYWKPVETVEYIGDIRSQRRAPDTNRAAVF